MCVTLYKMSEKVGIAFVETQGRGAAYVGSCRCRAGYNTRRMILLMQDSRRGMQVRFELERCDQDSAIARRLYYCMIKDEDTSITAIRCSKGKVL